MRIIKLFIFLFSLNMAAQNGALNTTEVKAFKAGVMKKSNAIQSFSADFLQTKHMKTMDGNAESAGKVFFKNPDMLKWEYTRPYNYKLLFRDSKMYIVEDGHS